MQVEHDEVGLELIDERGDFELVTGGPVSRVRCLTKPTGVIQPPLGKSLLWRLVSALSLNHLSLVEGGWPFGAWLVLVLWALAAGLAAARWFRWSD